MKFLVSAFADTRPLRAPLGDFIHTISPIVVPNSDGRDEYRRIISEMSDTVWIENKEYISSKRASELSGYAQDYIGQLARKGLIDARRVGGLWHISMKSLSEYKSHADTYIPQAPERKEPVDVDSLISFDGKDHISASRAAKITGYHPDYVGQLARSGSIISRQVGNRWYIDREGILAHKREKDNLLGAVQAESVGLARNAESTIGGNAPVTHYNGSGPLLTYTRDDRELLPDLNQTDRISPDRHITKEQQIASEPDENNRVPIRVLSNREILHHTAPVKHVKSRGAVHGKTINYGTFSKMAAAAFTVVIVLSFGFVTLKNSSIYGTAATPSGTVIQKNMFIAAAAETIRWVGNFLQNLLVRDLIYKRGE